MTKDQLDALPGGTVIYYRVFYDNWHHQLVEKFSGDGMWYFTDFGLDLEDPISAMTLAETAEFMSIVYLPLGSLA